jgi:hypothetical protein
MTRSSPPGAPRSPPAAARPASYWSAANSLADIPRRPDDQYMTTTKANLLLTSTERSVAAKQQTGRPLGSITSRT